MHMEHISKSMLPEQCDSQKKKDFFFFFWTIAIK